MTVESYTYPTTVPGRTDGNSRYGPAHQSVLLAAAEDGREHFRPGVVTARLGLSLAEGQRVVLELIEMGFVVRETIRHVRRVGSYPCAHHRCEGPDETGNYFYVEHEQTPFCELTDDGSSEVERLQKHTDVPLTLKEYANEVARLRAEADRLVQEARLLSSEDEKLFAANQTLEAEVRRLRVRVAAEAARTCAKCAARSPASAKFCPRCGRQLSPRPPVVGRTDSARRAPIARCRE